MNLPDNMPGTPEVPQKAVVPQKAETPVVPVAKPEAPQKPKPKYIMVFRKQGEPEDAGQRSIAPALPNHAGANAAACDCTTG
jgi:hypothetical protein